MRMMQLEDMKRNGETKKRVPVAGSNLLVVILHKEYLGEFF
jgi:hypothetical protein